MIVVRIIYIGLLRGTIKCLCGKFFFLYEISPPCKGGEKEGIVSISILNN